MLLLAVGAIGIGLATRGDDTSSARDTSSADASSEPRSPDSTPDSSGSAPAEEESEPPAPEPSPEESESEPDDGDTTSEDPTAFAETYYAYLPDDPRSAYRLLSDDYRARVSRGDYEGFWNTVEDVEVGGVEMVDDSTVDVALTYVTANGREQETRRLYLTEADGGWVIADDEAVAA